MLMRMDISCRLDGLVHTLTPTAHGCFDRLVSVSRRFIVYLLKQLIYKFVFVGLFIHYYWLNVCFIASRSIKCFIFRFLTTAKMNLCFVQNFVFFKCKIKNQKSLLSI